MSTADPAPKSVELLSRRDCHLCRDARELLDAATRKAGLTFAEIDVDADPELRAEWGDMVPVILIDGVCHGYYTFRADRLAQALQA